MKKNIVLYVIIVFSVIIACYACSSKKAATASSTLSDVSPSMGDVIISIATTGIVQPKNRVNITPSLSGRVEDVLVKIGDKVKKGSVLAWMSSDDRAALIDAASSKGAEELKYWEEVYKPTPLKAPIDGEVIVRGVEPGQTAASSTIVIVLSDTLIVQAKVDETDIGKVKVGQSAMITLDAYPDVKVRGRVDLISYDSTTVNNVTIYEVNIVPDSIPSIFRSGMSANIDIIQKEKNNIMLLASSAIKKDGDKSYVFLSKGENNGSEKQEIIIGLSDQSNTEIVSGLGLNDKVILEVQDFVLSQKTEGSNNPFVMGPPKMKNKK